MAKGPLFILSGPSGSGKSTLVRRLLDVEGLRLRVAVSATTRARRERETDGVHYHFWSKTEFEKALAADRFLEWAEVFGHLYGTPREEVERARIDGQSVLLEIDVQGAAQVRQRCPDAVSIFLRAEAPDTYTKRLHKRDTESPEQLEQRIKRALEEEARAAEFDHVVVNDDLDKAVREVLQIIHSHSLRTENA